MAAFRAIAFSVGVMLSLQGCANRLPRLVRGGEAYAAFPAPRDGVEAFPYVIGPLDRIAVTVYQEDDLSVRDVQVDSSGNILLPLIGEVRAAGLTTPQLSARVATLLGARYLVNPQVSAIVQQSVSQKVTVVGSVSEPGIFALQGRTTLLDAVAMARGTTRVAALDSAVVFRQIKGERFGALFDLRKIQRGEAADPEIIGNDQVVIGHSDIKAAWRDLLTAAPLITAAQLSR